MDLKIPKRYLSLIDRRILYWPKKPSKAKWGILRKFEVHKGNTIKAVIEKPDIYLFSPHLDHVPLTNIAEHNFGESNSAQNDANNGFSLSETGIQYYGSRYTKTEHHDLYKVGDEVVWTLTILERRNSKNPLIGKILMLVTDEHKEYFALIQFDEPTGYLSNPCPSPELNGQSKRNIVSLNELIKLELYLKSMETTSENLENSNYHVGGSTSKPELQQHYHHGETASCSSYRQHSDNSNLISFEEEQTQAIRSYAQVTRSTRAQESHSKMEKTTYSSVDNFASLTSSTYDSQFPARAGSSKTPRPLERSKIVESEQPPPSTFVKHRPSCASESYYSTDTLPGEPVATSNGIFKEQDDSDSMNSTPIDMTLLRLAIENDDSNTKTRLFGIQGGDNSCYMDASIFALFAFNNAFYHHMISQEERQEENIMRKFIRQKIVHPWRRNYFVPKENMKLLRDIFAKKFNNAFKASYMDAEEFLLSLFQTLEIPSLFQYDYGGEELIHQVMLPMTWDDTQKVKGYVTLHSLLQTSFESSEVLLASKPKIFIVKLPVSEGVLLPCDGVVPNLTLDIGRILNKKRGNVDMHLSAIIFLQSNHFVVVARTSINVDAPWVFMDSKPTTSLPELMFLDDLSQWLVESEELLGNGKEQLFLEDPRLPSGYALFGDAYICIYTDEYGFSAEKK